MNAVITEERSVVIEIDATSCVTETADTTDKNQTAMPLVGGEQKPMMNVQGHPTGASNLNVVLLNVVHFG